MFSPAAGRDATAAGGHHAHASVTHAATEPLPKKKKNRAAQAERVRRELELSLEGGGVSAVRAVEECSG